MNWIEQTSEKIAESVLSTKGKNARIICASGISPSGPIHLGNLREVITVHLVVEELRRRGQWVEHIHSWDDFDRLRKVPQGISDKYVEYIGMPLSAIPDPFNCHQSYAEHYKQEFINSIEQLGIFPRYISQTEAYQSGVYKEYIKLAMRERMRIFDILAKYQTLDTHEKVTPKKRKNYYPFRVYCENCNRDTTTIIRYDPKTSITNYSCAYCHHHGNFSLDEKSPGKLVWKIDWPMRWAFEKVDFEPAGEDHSAPGSSFTVGEEVVTTLFAWQAPVYLGYAFVGIGGRSKISGSLGTTITPQAALEILEPSILRWLYVRRNAQQPFKIDFGKEVIRLYDEWDSLARRIESGGADSWEKKTYSFSTQTSEKYVSKTINPLPFRFLSSIADVTQGNRSQIMRIITEHYGDIIEDQMEPRMSCAVKWATAYQPEDERTIVRDTFAADVYAGFTEETRYSIDLLASHLKDNWTLKKLTALLYGVPKMTRGLPLDAPPSKELKIAQRSLFVALYKLICTSDTGPRLPTLFLSLGLNKVLSLLSAQEFGEP